MSRDAPSTASGRALLGAASRLRRVLLLVTGILVLAQALWILAVGAQRPLATLLVGAVATTALLSSIWAVLGRMARSGFAALAAWVAGGYLLRIGILLVALLGGRAAGLDVAVMGISLISAIIAGMLAETIILARARIPAVEPRAPDTPA
ncbi:pseudouridine synthase [Actinomyces bowdenii]|uniref:Pseudouridine synthase n=1 Tax=Actinomyces bowdenii TaxID=131109 RepID=A0A3P1V922_9ACTO|nr:pseudouridine synthase [Actinomyces bowdenii]MBO3724815.1 pseudouridine synthase [Actinomyces bowdenii]RRD30641.1 pseudouridine synthase [Actinomyces bowdenii]